MSKREDLRDKIAIEAMAAILISTAHVEYRPVARMSYDLANIMLEEKDKAR